MSRFAAVGLASFALDCLVLWLTQSASGSLLAAVVVARIVSGAANFTANRLFVFRARDISWQQAARRYIALAAVLLAANYGLLYVLTGIGVPTLVAKALTEATLFSISFVAQRLVVFARRHGRPQGTIVPWPGGPVADASSIADADARELATLRA